MAPPDSSGKPHAGSSHRSSRNDIIRIQKTVVKEIRSSLFHATRVLNDGEGCAYKGAGGGCPSGGTPPSLASSTSPLGGRTVSTPDPPSHAGLACGRWTYSHVKREWNVRHRPVTWDSSAATTTMDVLAASPAWNVHRHRRAPIRRGRSADAQVASAASHSKWVASLSSKEDQKESSNTKKRTALRWGRKRRRMELELDDNYDAARQAPRQPPLALVECILLGAEFVSMLQQARTELSRDTPASIRCWSRANKSVDLQPVLNHLASLSDCSPSEDGDDEIVFGELLDQCISMANRCVHDLAAPWQDAWRVRLPEQGFSVNLDDLSESVSSNRTKHFRNDSCTAAIRDFVGACLGPISPKEIESFRDEKCPESFIQASSTSKEIGNDTHNSTATPERKKPPGDQQPSCLLLAGGLRNNGVSQVHDEGSTSADHQVLPDQKCLYQAHRPLARALPSTRTSNIADLSSKHPLSPSRQRANRRKEDLTVFSPLVLAKNHTTVDSYSRKVASKSNKRCTQRGENADSNLSSLNGFFGASPEQRRKPGTLKQSPRRRIMQWNDSLSPLVYTGSANRFSDFQEADDSTRLRQKSSIRENELPKKVAITAWPFALELEGQDTSNEGSYEKGEEEFDQDASVGIDELHEPSDAQPQESQYRSCEIPPESPADLNRDCGAGMNGHQRISPENEAEWDKGLTHKSSADQRIEKANREGESAQKERNSTENSTYQRAFPKDGSGEQVLQPAGLLSGSTDKCDELEMRLESEDPCRHSVGNTDAIPNLVKEGGGNLKRRDVLTVSLPERSGSSTSDVEGRLISGLPSSQIGDATSREIASIVQRNLSKAPGANKASKIRATPKKKRTSYDIIGEDSPGTLFDRRGRKVRPEDVSGTSWVRLSHMGHVSDYHGYSRKYENFFPLRFHSSVAATQEDIRKTLESAQCDLCGHQAGKDIAGELEGYRTITKNYKALIVEERKRKRSRDRDEEALDDSNGIDVKILESMPIMFGSGLGFEEEKCDTLTGCKLRASSARLCEENCCPVPASEYKYIEEEDVVIHYDDHDGDNGKRMSRSAQIASQKKTSYMMLKELLNTLSFIEKYNAGFKPEIAEGSDDNDDTQPQQHGEKEVFLSGEDISEFDVNDSRYPPKKKRAPNKSKAGNHPEQTTEPKWAALTHKHHFHSYDDLQMKNAFYFSLKKRGKTIASAQKVIKAILDDDDTLDGFFLDDEIVLEEKEYSRALRSYRGKSDQERIEKKDHEEKRKLEIREFEYYRTRGKKKLPPMEIETKIIPKRHLNFIRGDEGLPHDLEPCPFGIDCLICAPILQSTSGSLEKGVREEEIFNPIFRRVDEETYLPVDSAPMQKRMSRREENCSQKTASALKLAELYNTLAFIEEYNKGLIKPGEK